MVDYPHQILWKSVTSLIDEARFPVGAGNVSLRHHVHTGSGAHPASYSMDTGGSFRAWCIVKHRDNFTFTKRMTSLYAFTLCT
jgi:hypothetical protein